MNFVLEHKVCINMYVLRKIEWLVLQHIFPQGRTMYDFHNSTDTLKF